ncbi:MAG TPA: type VI secretion system baseplate subunit TssG [Planctomycetota bacterium]
MSGLEALTAQAQRYELASALRLLECLFRDHPRLGQSVRPSDDAVRLGQEPHMMFAPGTIAEFAADGRGKHAGTLRIYPLGLLGPNGPLPLHLTEYALDRLRRSGDRTLRSFFDLFHHRILSLFWRAAANAQPAVELDRPEQDRFARYFGALAGFASQAVRDADPRVDRARRHWIGHFARQVRNCEGLQALISGFFGIVVRIEEFVGRWLPMPGNERCRLGSAGAALGGNAFLGDDIWDCTQTIHIVCGPLDLAHYEQLLPCGESWRRLGALVRSYVGFEVAWEVRLVLKQAEIPPLKLNDGHLRDGKRLGWTTWLGPTPASTGADGLLLQPDRPYRHDIRPRSEIA